MEFTTSQETLRELVTQGAMVLADGSGFTINQGEKNDKVVYPMSNIFPSLFANPHITGDELKVWLYLKSLENTQIKGAFPKIEAIMQHQSMGKQKLLKVINSLEEKNMLLRINRRWYDSNIQTSNIYFFNVPDPVTGEFPANGLDSIKEQFPSRKALAGSYKSGSTIQLLLLPVEKDPREKPKKK